MEALKQAEPQEAEATHDFFDTEKEYKLIFSKNLAMYLNFTGHKIVRIEKHRTKGSPVYVFKNSNLLHYDIDDYTEMKRQGRA